MDHSTASHFITHTHTHDERQDLEVQVNQTSPQCPLNFLLIVVCQEQYNKITFHTKSS